MTPQRLAEIGDYIWGRDWIPSLTYMLGMEGANSPRLMQRWLSGKQPIPEGAAADIETLYRIVSSGRRGPRLRSDQSSRN